LVIAHSKSIFIQTIQT